MALVRAAMVICLLAGCSSPAPQAEHKGAELEQAAPRAQDAAAPAQDAAAPAQDSAAPAIGPATASKPDQPVLSMGGASVFGGDSFTIHLDGRARFAFIAPGKPEVARSGRLKAAELAALRDRLAAAGCCSLVSQRTMGVPDEGHTTLQLGFADLVCSVTLWDNEWHELPAAAKCAKVLEPIRRRLR